MDPSVMKPEKDTGTSLPLLTISVGMMRYKSESFKKFKEFQNEVQNQIHKKIKLLRSD